MIPRQRDLERRIRNRLGVSWWREDVSGDVRWWNRETVANNALPLLHIPVLIMDSGMDREYVCGFIDLVMVCLLLAPAGGILTARSPSPTSPSTTGGLSLLSGRLPWHHGTWPSS